MEDLDEQLINWAIQKIKTEYKEDVALLIGQEGSRSNYDVFIQCHCNV